MNLRSIFILKPEVKVMVFQRMRSDKITKNGENALKMQFEGLISACIYLSKRGIRKRSILKPKVEVVVFLRIRV
mgnify:FL=1